MKKRVSGHDLNSLTATALTFRDLENKSKASTWSVGIGMSANGVFSPLISPPAKMSERGVAKSTVSPATLDLSDQRQDLAALNRDASDANHQVDGYDIEALRARQQDAAIISQALNMAVGDIAHYAGFEEGSAAKIVLHAALERRAFR